MDTRQADQALAVLSARKNEWARLPIRDKIRYLKQIRQLALTHAQRWADAETKAKQLAPGSPLIGAEAWIAGPYGLISWLTAAMKTLAVLDEGGDLLAQVKTRRSADGKLIARVLPAGTCERLLFHGITAEVWMQDGVTEQNLRQNMAGFYRQADPDGAVALVLGARNVPAIVPLDIAHRMINCGQVVICKMNPVNEHPGPIFEDIFAPLIHGPRPTSGTRPSTSPPRNCTTPGTTASPARSSSCPPTGTATTPCSATSAASSTRPRTAPPTTPAPASG